MTFEDREPSSSETAAWIAALDLGDAGRSQLREGSAAICGRLVAGREATLAALARRDDDWLELPLPATSTLNAHWAWFHVAEDEINHRGQIRWLRTRLTRGPASETRV